MKEPIRVAAAIHPYWTGSVGENVKRLKIPNSEPMTGSTREMMMISKATNVHANPVIATIRRWKAVNPPSRRTSSTVRVAVAIGTPARRSVSGY